MPIQEFILLKKSWITQGFFSGIFAKHVVPKSVFQTFATNEVLQIVLFSIMFGIILHIWEMNILKPVIKFLEGCSSACYSKNGGLYHVVRSTWCFRSY